MYDDNNYDSGEYYEPSRGHRRPPPPPPRRARDREPDYEPKRVSFKCIGGMVVAIVALIFVLMLMYMGFTWYSITYEATPEGTNIKAIEYEFEYFADEVSATIGFGGNSTTNTTSYDDEDVKDYVKDVKEVMDMMNTFFLITVILLIVAIALIPVAAIGKIPHGIAMAILLIALIITIISPLYFFVYFPPAVESQFNEAFGNTTGEIQFIYEAEFIGEKHGEFPLGDLQFNFNMEYGPGIAFWLAFVPMFIILIAIAVYSGGKRDLRTMRRPPPPPRGRGYRDEYDEYDEPPDRGRPPPRGRPPYGPPRRDYEPRGGRREDDYARGPPRSHRSRDYGYDEGGGDEHYRPPVLDRERDYGRPPPRPPRQRRR